MTVYREGAPVAGLDLSSKLRRGLGGGSIIPYEAIAQMMRPFDKDRDGALFQDELCDFLKKYRVGGPWFCEMVGKTLWNFCTTWYSKDVTWIKIDALAWMLHQAMHQRARPAQRYRITPEGAMGYVPLEPMEGSQPVDKPKNLREGAAGSAGGDSRPRPGPSGPGGQGPGPGAQGAGHGAQGPGPGQGPGPRRPAPRARAGARPGPRRPGPRRPGPRSR